MENKQQRGTDLRLELTITPEEAAQGCQKEIVVLRYERCQTCDGKSQDATTRCGQCHGERRVQESRRIALNIPVGVKDGVNIRLTGAGNAGSSGSPRGNLYVVLSVPSATPTNTPPVPPEKQAEDRITAVWDVGDFIDKDSEVRAILGEGGMGTVYRVYYRPWNRELAVKCPQPEIFTRTDGKARFIQEAEIWTTLGPYPHIVRGYYVRMINGIPHVFAEYVSGGSLSQWIAQRKLYAGGPGQAISRILDIAIQMAWGLHFAHAGGLIHQDVKPANVMMTEEGIAKVTDFGLAKACLFAGEAALAPGSGQMSLQVSSRGMTPTYCSPEQAAGRPLSRKTDIWSWGVSVLEMFVGKVSWRVGVVAREVLVGYQALDPALPVMPEAVSSVLSSCFQPEPDARPATMLAVAAELQRIYAGYVGRPYARAMPTPPEIRAVDLLARGSSLAELGRPEEALAVFEQSLRLDPNDAATHQGRGYVLHELGRLEEALVAFEQSLRLDPNHSGTHTSRGIMLAELGQPEEALAAFEQSLHLNPNDADTHYQQGYVLRELGRFEEAEQAFHQAEQSTAAQPPPSGHHRSD